MGVFRPFGGGGNAGGIPSSAIVVKADATTGSDAKGQRSGTIEQRRYGQLLAGEYATNASIVGTETVTVPNQGTATIAVSAGRITFGAGTAWGFGLSNGSLYEYPQKISSAKAIWVDVSGFDRHLIMTEGSGLGDVDSICLSSLLFGSDSINNEGYSYRENLIYARPTSNANITVAHYGEYDILTKNVDGAANSISLLQLHSVAEATKYNAIITVRKVTGDTLPFCIGWYSSGWSGLSASIISGPGAVSYVAGLPTITGLSSTSDTVIELSKNNFTIGSSFPNLWIYPSGINTALSGNGCLIKDYQVYAGNNHIDNCFVLGVWGCNYQKSTHDKLDVNRNKILCLGDSLTTGYSDIIKNFKPKSYFIKSSVSGELSQNTVSRLSQTITLHDPDIVILLIGTNDAYGSVDINSTKENILYIIQHVTGLGKEIILSTLTPSNGHDGYNSGIQEFIDEFNEWIKSLPYKCADLYTLWGGGSTTMIAQYDNGDHLHPSVGGSIVQAALFADTIGGFSGICDSKRLPLLSSGRIKYPITLSGGTLFESSTTYTLPEAPELIDLLGADSTWYNADGTAKTLNDTQFRAAINEASDWKVCANPDHPEKGVVICDQSKAMLKALRLA